MFAQSYINFWSAIIQFLQTQMHIHTQILTDMYGHQQKTIPASPAWLTCMKLNDKMAVCTLKKIKEIRKLNMWSQKHNKGAEMTCCSRLFHKQNIVAKKAEHQEWQQWLSITNECQCWQISPSRYKDTDPCTDQGVKYSWEPSSIDTGVETSRSHLAH